MDFSNQDGLRELTCALLEKDFDLKVEIPPNYLIPTVPQKLNYIHWVEDLLNYGGVATHEEGVACEGIPQGKDVLGIDIGNGGPCDMMGQARCCGEC
jgi:methyltransferase